MHIVRHALKQRTVQIVTYDWLEDSLIGKHHKREKAYLLSTVEKAKRKQEKEQKREADAGMCDVSVMHPFFGP